MEQKRKSLSLENPWRFQNAAWGAFERKGMSTLFNVSSIEEDHLIFDKKTNYIIEPQKQFPWLKTSRTMPLEVYLPELNLAIECQGMQHFYANKIFGGKKVFIIQKQKDELKYRLCNDHNISILYFAATTYKVPEKYLGPVFIRLEELLNEIKRIVMQ